MDTNWAYREALRLERAHLVREARPERPPAPTRHYAAIPWARTAGAALLIMLAFRLAPGADDLVALPPAPARPRPT